MSKIKSFPYYGGKLSHLDFLQSHLPYTERYIEPFGGSAAVLLNREPSPVETYNDIDGDMVNFFRVLREQPDELIRQLELTPHSREEFETAREPKESIDDIERARRFFVRVSQGFNALSSADRTGWSYNIGDSRRNRSLVISSREGYVSGLDLVADRLSRVQIENRPAVDVIETHDHEDALFYCDPPYTPDARRTTMSERGYGFEMDEEEHRELASVLHQCDGKVAISNYESELLRELYPDWTVIIDEERASVSSSRSTSNAEILIMNYDPDDVTPHPGQGQATLTEAVE